ncbi:MAG TPA: type II secretion system F family protein [Terriglobia bacterium]|nr:type II secretion system F family protein [Terriglobia bacterium]
MQLLLAGLTFLIVAMLAAAVFLLAGRRRPNAVRTRLEALEKGAAKGNVTVAATTDLVRDESFSDVPVLHKLLTRWSWSTRLRDWIGQAGMTVKPGKLILVSGVVGLGAGVVAQHLYASPFVPIPAGLTAAFVPLGVVLVKRSRRLHAFEKGFPEAIDLLARSVRAGYSFSTGLEVVANELSDPVAGEFRATFDEQNFGLPLRDAFLNLSARVPIIDVRFFVTAILIHKETGGNLAEILDNLAHVIRERFRIVGEVRTRTAQGRMTAGVLIALPPAMLVVLRVMNPDYVNLLFTDPWGSYMLGGAAIMQVIGALVLWKIVNIAV